MCGTVHAVYDDNADDRSCGHRLCERFQIKLQKPAIDSFRKGAWNLIERDRGFKSKNNGEWSEIQVGGSKTTVYVASRYLTASKPQAGNGSTSTAAGGTAAVSADGTVSVPDSLKAYVDKAWQVGMNSGWKYADFSAINSGHAVYYHNGTANRKIK